MQHKFALGWVDGTKGYLGNYIWNDANYDGLQGMSEEGIGGMKVSMDCPTRPSASVLPHCSR